MFCIEKWSFLFFWFYSSFVFFYKGVYIIFADLNILLHRLDLFDWFLPVVLFDKVSKSQYVSQFLALTKTQSIGIIFRHSEHKHRFVARGFSKR